MTNTLMYLEDSIAQNTNGEYTTIYPYIIYAKGTFIPRFQFAESNSKFPIPEFYHDYPIFMDSNAYEDLNEDYYTIYKVFDTTSSLDVELIPEDSVHSIQAEIKEIDVYLIEAVDSELSFARYIGTYNSDSFSFNNVTGILTLDPDFSALKDVLYLLETDNPENIYYYIFEVKVEKYRDVADLQGFTQEEVDHIATMQAVEQSIFEYMYQYTHGCKTQQGLSEMFYTFYVTSISTIITTAITLGIGLVAKGLNSVANSIPSMSVMGVGENIGSVATSTFAQNLISVFAGYATLGSWQMLKVIFSPITETLQEIFVDPYLETIVTKMVGDIGLGVFWQVLASSLVEGGRESLTGPMSTFLFGNQQQSPSSQVDSQQVTSAMNSEQQQNQNSIEQTESLRSVKVSWSSVLKTGASLLLGTAMMSLGGPMFFGASLTMGFSAVKSSVNSFEFRKKVLRNTLIRLVDEKVTEELADTTTWATMESIQDLVVESKISPVPKDAVSNPKRPLFEKTAMWLRSHKKAGVSAAVLPIGVALISPMMLLVGLTASAVIGGITIMARMIKNYVQKTVTGKSLLPPKAERIISRDYGGKQGHTQDFLKKIWKLGKHGSQYIFGIIYKWTNKKTGKVYIGRTERSRGTPYYRPFSSISIRFQEEIEYAIFTNIGRLQNGENQMYYDMRMLYDAAGKGKAGINAIVNGFGLEIVEVQVISDSYKRDCMIIEHLEDGWISSTSRDYELYNVATGSTGKHVLEASSGHAAKELHAKIRYMIENGFSKNEIKDYVGISNIDELISRACDSMQYSKAKLEYVGTKLLKLISNGVFTIRELASYFRGMDVWDVFRFLAREDFSIGNEYLKGLIISTYLQLVEAQLERPYPHQANIHTTHVAEALGLGWKAGSPFDVITEFVHKVLGMKISELNQRGYDILFKNYKYKNDIIRALKFYARTMIKFSSTEAQLLNNLGLDGINTRMGIDTSSFINSIFNNEFDKARVIFSSGYFGDLTIDW